MDFIPDSAIQALAAHKFQSAGYTWLDAPRRGSTDVFWTHGFLLFMIYFPCLSMIQCLYAIGPCLPLRRRWIHFGHVLWLLFWSARGRNTSMIGDLGDLCFASIVYTATLSRARQLSGTRRLLPNCQMNCQTRRQNICQIERIECQIKCQIECQTICEIECFILCWIECQMSDRMWGKVSDRMPVGGDHWKKVVIAHKSDLQETENIVLPLNLKDTSHDFGCRVAPPQPSQSWRGPPEAPVSGWSTSSQGRRRVWNVWLWKTQDPGWMWVCLKMLG